MTEIRDLSARLYERLQARQADGVSHERSDEGLARSVETAMILAGESAPTEHLTAATG